TLSYHWMGSAEAVSGCSTYAPPLLIYGSRSIRCAADIAASTANRLSPYRVRHCFFRRSRVRVPGGIANAHEPDVRRKLARNPRSQTIRTKHTPPPDEPLIQVGQQDIADCPSLGPVTLGTVNEP